MVLVFTGILFYIRINWIEILLKPWPDAQVPSFDSEFSLWARISDTRIITSSPNIEAQANIVMTRYRNEKLITPTECLTNIDAHL